MAAVHAWLRGPAAVARTASWAGAARYSTGSSALRSTAPAVAHSLVRPNVCASAARTGPLLTSASRVTSTVRCRGLRTTAAACQGYGYMGPLAGAHLGHAGPYGHAGSEGGGYGPQMYATTILSVRKDGKVAVVGDGQVTQGSQVMKPNATKVRRLGDDVIAGFAGATADALTLIERLEMKLEQHPQQLTRACVDLAKEWRTEKYLRRLEAIMLVVDKDVSLTVTGMGDVIEPPDGIIAIGSGGSFALAAARALIDHPDLDAMEIAERAMKIAADICVYTNHNFVKDQLPDVADDRTESDKTIGSTSRSAPPEESDSDSDE